MTSKLSYLAHWFFTCRPVYDFTSSDWNSFGTVVSSPDGRGRGNLICGFLKLDPLEELVVDCGSLDSSHPVRQPTHPQLGIVHVKVNQLFSYVYTCI